MRFSIPVTALITLLVSTGDSFAAPVAAAIRSPLNIQSNFSCNEPFMIPAEYIDPRGNSFAMCFSDPRFHHENIIWYIQGMAGSFKAVGVAHREGSHEFVGSVFPIEQPADLSGMHAEPVAVNVRLDRAAGVITINPLKTAGTLVNWIIRPNGFPSGSLKVPHACGPFLRPLGNDELLAPLTGAGHKAKVCLIPGAGMGDAFISWGRYKHDNDNRQLDPITLDDGYINKFFSVGFIGAERGVSIDICDPGNGDANRCEMSKLVGNTRKTFVVGSGNDVDLPKPLKAEIAEEVVEGPGRPRRHAHEIRSDALIKKVDMIERNIKSLLTRSRADNFARTARRRDNLIDRPVERATCPLRRHPVAGVKADYLVDRPVEIVQNELIDGPLEIVQDQIIDRPVENFRRRQVRDGLVDRPVEVIQDEIIERPFARADLLIDRPIERARRDVLIDRPIEQARRDFIIDRPLERPAARAARADLLIDRPIEQVRRDFIIDRPLERPVARADLLIDRPIEKARRDVLIDRPLERPVARADLLIDRPIEKARRDVLIDRPIEQARRRQVRDELIDRPLEIIQDEIIERPAEIIRENSFYLRADAVVDTPVERARRAAVVAEPLDNPAAVARRRRNCPVNPLLYPPRPVQKAAVAAAVSTPRPFVVPPPVVQPLPVVNPNIYRLEADTLAQYNRLRIRLNRLDRRLDNAESIIASRLASFNDWLHRQKVSMEDRGRDFVNFLAGLKADVVYTPKSKKKTSDFLSKIGSAFRGAEKEVKSTAAKVKQEIFDPAANVVSDTVVASGNVVDNTVGAGGNVLDSTVVTAKRVVESPISAVGNGLDAAAGVAARTVNVAVDPLPLVDPVVRPIAPARAVAVSERFDFNDDLLPPARAAVVGPKRLVDRPVEIIDEVIINPLGPVGPVGPVNPLGPVGPVDPLGPVGPALPPPAVRQFNRNNNDPIRAAIDYLN